jgi:hypothetical protein
MGPSTSVLVNRTVEYIWDSDVLVRAQPNDRIVATIFCNASLNLENGVPVAANQRPSSYVDSQSGVMLWRSSATNISSVTVVFARAFLKSPFVSFRPLNVSNSLPVTFRSILTNKGFQLSVNTTLNQDFLLEWAAREAGMCLLFCSPSSFRATCVRSLLLIILF